MTLKEYMDDPEIIHEPMAMREIHAIRLKMHDERAHLTPEEYNNLVHQGAQRFLSEPVRPDLIGLSARELAQKYEAEVAKRTPVSADNVK